MGDFEEEDPKLPRCPIEGKVCFRKRDAQTKRNTIARSGRSRTMRIYQCEHCETWHLTSQRRRNLEKQKRCETNKNRKRKRA